MKIVNPPLFVAKRTLNIGQAMSSVCADAIYRYTLMTGKEADYSSMAYNAQGKPLDQRVDFKEDLDNYQKECILLANESIQNIEKYKSRINILQSPKTYLDFSESSHQVTQEKFLELLNNGFLIRDKKNFYLNVKKIKSLRDIQGILDEIKFKPENFRKTLEQLLHDITSPLQITKPRLFATSIPVYFCSNCSQIYPTKGFMDTRKNALECPSCNKQNRNELTDTLDPLFNLSVQGYSLSPKESPADVQICGRNMATRYLYYSFLTHAAIDNRPAFKNLIVHNILNDDSGKRLSNQNQNMINIEDISKEFHGDAIRYALFKSLSFKDETVNLSNNLFKDGQKAVYKIGNLRKFFKSHNIDFKDISFNQNLFEHFSELMGNMELRKAFDLGQTYLNQLSLDIKKEHDSHSLNNFLEKAERYKTIIYMTESFMPEIAEKSKKELDIAY